MTMYVLVRTDGMYVARGGTVSSYTARLQEARIFASREAAERERCPENERVVDVYDVLRD